MTRYNRSLAVLDRALVVLVLGANILASAPAQAEGNSNPGVIPPHAKYGGLTLGEWNVRLWQRLYAYLSFTPDSPTFDATGANFGVDQSQPVWFLTLPGPNPVREVTVPTGVALLVTLGSGTVGGFPWDPPTDQLQAVGAVILSQWLLNPQLTVDGNPIKDLASYAVISPLFNFTLPPNNAAGLPAGEYGPAVTTGITPLLAPMSAGRHVIQYSWDVATGQFAGHYDTTYIVNVVPWH